MTTTNQSNELGKTELNDFEAGWLQGELVRPAIDEASAAVVKDAKDAAAQSDTEYVQAHTDLESENK